MKVAGGGGYRVMSQHPLEGEDIAARFKIMGGKTVSEDVNASGPGYSGQFLGPVINLLGGSPGQMMTRVAAGEEPGVGPAEPPVGTEFRQQAGR